jgi:probable F420-dependent oxidoreductase
MKYGLTIFPTDYSIHPAELAVAAEEHGFESLWVPEHSHFPVSPFTPGRNEGSLAAEYYDVMDPFVALAMAAQATRELLVGTSICLVVQRDPIQLAKQVASLDALSGGRFQFGVGGGWHPLEMANHGTAFVGRMELLRERVQAMQAIWTEEKAEYHGALVNFDPIYQWPKPRQKPHPPIHVGTNTPKLFHHVVAYGDGWFPIVPAGEETEAIAKLGTLREQLEAAGRDPATVETSIYMCPAEEQVVRRYAQAGVARVIFRLAPEPRDAVLPAVDRLAELRTRCEERI